MNKIGIAALAIALLGACGDGDDKVATSTTSPAPETTTTVAPTTTAPPTTVASKAVATAPVTTPPKPVTIDIPASKFTSASSWDVEGPAYWTSSGPYNAAFGSKVGRLVYEFAAPYKPANATIVTRMSAEFKGSNGPPDGLSDVTLVANGRTVQSQRVQRDDGIGALYTWRVPAIALTAGKNTISFEVTAGAEKPNGLCIYDEPREAGRSRDPIKITLTG